MHAAIGYKFEELCMCVYLKQVIFHDIWMKCISWFETINLKLYLLSRITIFVPCVNKERREKVFEGEVMRQVQKHRQTGKQTWMKRGR